jgi:hypothetical protein
MPVDDGEVGDTRRIKRTIVADHEVGRIGSSLEFLGRL